MTRLRVLGAATVFAAAAASAVLFTVLFPLTVRDAAVQAGLLWGGVRAVRWGALTGLLRDTCRPGEPCRCAVLVHGLGDTSATWRDILLGDAASPVPSGWKLFAPDMPGTGDSPAPAAAEGFAQPRQAEALRAALSPVCAKWTVVGNSLGGWSSSWLALEWPQGVERLILLSPAGLKDPTGASESTARALAYPSVSVLKEFNKRVTHVERKVPDRAFAQMAELLKGRPVRKNLEAIRDEHFLDGRLRDLKVPVTILWGASDKVILPSQAEAFRRELPSASISPLPACGHLPQLECPAPVRAALFAR